MEYRRFGKTEWEVSEIGMGGSWFYGRPEEGKLPVSHGVGVVERALELGVNYFDTAPLYGQGQSEEVLGTALRGVSESHFLATKVGYLPEPFDYTRDSVWRGLDASLRRLGRERVDLLQIHEAEKAGWEGIFGKGRTLEALVEMQEQGITQFIGLTGSDLSLMRKALSESALFASVLTFCKYDLLTQDAKSELVPGAVEEDVALVAASPLHGGLLGAKREKWMAQGRFQELHDRLKAVEDLLRDEPEGLQRTALRYLLSDPRVSTVLCGVANVDELEVCASVSDGRVLDEARISEIEGVGV